jgi:putative ABC transport system substrate-binding protein
MKRRNFIALLGAAAAWPLAARAQQREPTRRVGVLMPYAQDSAAAQNQLSAFRDALVGLGWSAGRNLTFDYRWAGSSNDLVRAYAKELVPTSS